MLRQIRKETFFPHKNSRLENINQKSIKNIKSFDDLKSDVSSKFIFLRVLIRSIKLRHHSYPTTETKR